MRTSVLPDRAARRLRARTHCPTQESVTWNWIIMQSLEVRQRFIQPHAQYGSLLRIAFESGLARVPGRALGAGPPYRTGFWTGNRPILPWFNWTIEIR